MERYPAAARMASTDGVIDLAVAVPLLIVGAGPAALTLASRLKVPSNPADVLGARSPATKRRSCCTKNSLYIISALFFPARPAVASTKG